MRSRPTGGIPKGAAAGGGHRVADATALIGIALAGLAVLAVGGVSFSGPIVESLQGPDPCGAAKGVRGPEIDCVRVHPDYYRYDPATGYVNTRGSLISQAVDAAAWHAAPPLALSAAVISGLALAMGTRHSRSACSALTIGALISVTIGLYLLVLIGGGGD